METTPIEFGRLSQRQRQCLELVAKGYTSKQIARELDVSPSTVDNHIRGALERLNVSDRAAAARLFQAAEHQVRSAAVPPRPDRHSRLKLPPLGGVVNSMGAHQRVWHIVQIALVGIMGMTTAIVTIAGLVNLFKK